LLTKQHIRRFAEYNLFIYFCLLVSLVWRGTILLWGKTR